MLFAVSTVFTAFVLAVVMIMYKIYTDERNAIVIRHKAGYPQGKRNACPEIVVVPDRREKCELKIRFSPEVLDSFRTHVGKYRAETGGMLASSNKSQIIDRCYFDIYSKNTSGTFYYDEESMTKVYRDWKSKGYETNGIFHSHPRGVIHPSYHDISSVLRHLEFFDLDHFYLPIFQPEARGFYTMYFYIARRKEDVLEVNLEYVVQANASGYSYSVSKWKEKYSVRELKAYINRIDHVSDPEEKTVSASQTSESDAAALDKSIKVTASEVRKPSEKYFSKVRSLYPQTVLDKVILCVGTGGARSFLENMARSGFRNFVLIDRDVVSETNIATQGVFISELGKKKVEVIRDRILDINPEAKVVCVEKFLDEDMSDDEFHGYMDMFPNRKPKDYLILGCTDNFEAQKRSSLLALKYGVPYLAATMYQGGAAAEIIFVYPGVTESCPRCMLRSRFESYESGFVNDVDSSNCPIFATERMNSLKGFIALMLLMYREDANSPFSRMLDDVKNRNFVWIRLTPYLKDTDLKIERFDTLFNGISEVFFDETIWIPQFPDRPENGAKRCLLCGGSGDLTSLSDKWMHTDTRKIRFVKEPDLEQESSMLQSIEKKLNSDPIVKIGDEDEENEREIPPSPHG